MADDAPAKSRPVSNISLQGSKVPSVTAKPASKREEAKCLNPEAKAPSTKSQDSMSNPRILMGNDRTKFVKTVMESTFHPERTDAETVKISQKVSSRLSKLVAQQSDMSHLTKQSLPPIPKEYKGPAMSGNIENFRNNCFVVTNDAHSRGTNPGFIRNALGGFYCH